MLRLSTRQLFLSQFARRISQSGFLNDQWATFWNGDVAAWTGYVKVDGQTYAWMGAANLDNTIKATQKSLKFSSTQSIFTLIAGPIDLIATFLSPVEPSDLVNQSLPFSYLAVSVRSNDGNSHSVQVYTDITREWITGTNTWTANWKTTTGKVLTHQLQLSAQAVYEEVRDHIHYGAEYYSTLNMNGTTWQTGQDTVVRDKFIGDGALANTVDTYFRPVSYSRPVFGFSNDLGTVTSTATEPVVFVVGHVRDPAVQYITANNGRQDRSTLFWTEYKTISSAITAFIYDYPNAVTRANAFDAKVKADASRISSDYADVVALSVRQALGSIEITVSKKNAQYDKDDTLTFMKENSSDGNVNTVDVIFSAWPIFLYTNPALGRQLLAPLFEYQATGQYPNRWAVHDMGFSYPKAIGHNDGQDEAMQVEESGNILIMTLSLAQKANDTSLIKKYYNLLDQWTQYLIEDSLIPALQLSTDDFAGRLANQTNLTIKGIVGIKAMSEIAAIVGDDAKAKNYSDIATSYVQQWQNFALSGDKTHLTLSYGNDSSWGLTYNLYADKLLGTNVFPQFILDLR